MEYGIDSSDPFGVGALFLGTSLANKFGCRTEVDWLFSRLFEIETPQLPNESIDLVLAPIDRLLDEAEPSVWLLELIEALVRLGVHTPPTTPQAQHLFRVSLWITMRHDPHSASPVVLQILRDATPGARSGASQWPPHEFFSAVMVLVYLGGADARRELWELLAAARDLGYHDLAPVLEWYLDHQHSAPAR